MTGEHFSSSTGKDLDKKKDAYVRLRWETKKGEKRPKQTILEREKIEENKNLADYLTRHYSSVANKCVCCQKPACWPLVRFEFYNWEKPETESEVFAHDECLKKMAIGSVIEGLRLMGKNPTFSPELACLSSAKCRFFSKSEDFRNCRHIVLRFDVKHEDNPDATHSTHMRPILFCKRAHPGEAFLETEEETWWNVEDAGLVLMAKRLTDRLNAPEIRTQIATIKKENPAIIAQIKRALELDPSVFALFPPSFSFVVQALVEPTPEENWEMIQEGNDCY